jgi:hypothetical protein
MLGKDMLNYKLIKKGFTIAIIFIFIELACAPSIRANIHTENNLVEITTEICGPYGRKQTIVLTQKEVEEVQQLFDSIKKRVQTADSRKEVKEIFNNAVEKLNIYGLLGGLRVEQAKQIVSGTYLTPGVIHHSGNHKGFFKNTNLFCLVAGSTTITTVMTPRAIILYSLSRMNNLNASITSLLRKVFFNSLELSTFFIPILFFDIVFFGGMNNQPPFPHPVSSEGWIYSFGLMGVKNWNGSFYGDLPLPPLTMQLSQWEVYPGIIGLTGFKWCGLLDSSDIFFLGSALYLKLTDASSNA